MGPIPASEAPIPISLASGEAFLDGHLISTSPAPVDLGGIRMGRASRAAGAVAHRPDVLGGGLQPLVDLDVPPLVRLDPGLLEPNAVGVLCASPVDEEVRPLDLAARRPLANVSV
jgi:hypothetical protein